MAPHMLDAEVGLSAWVAELQALRVERDKLRAENLQLKRAKRQLEKLLSSTLATARAAAQAAEQAAEIIVERGNECEEEEVEREEEAWFVGEGDARQAQ